MSEIEEVKADVKEMKEDIKEVVRSVNSLHILVAGNYVTKEEFKEHEKEDSNAHRWFAGILVTIGLFILGLIVKGV